MSELKMRQRKLGRHGLVVSDLGLGCMGMSEFYGPRYDQKSIATLRRAVKLGIDFFDTSDMYGPYHNEELVGRTLKPMRDRVIIATKFGIVRHPDGRREINGRPCPAFCEGANSTRRLATRRREGRAAISHRRGRPRGASPQAPHG